MKKEIILKVSENEIYTQKRDLEETRETAQQYLEWHNGIEFCKKLTGIEEIKEFLTSPQAYYENEVRNYLAELTGLKTLPVNIENLTEMYQIPECEAWSLSESFGFEFLQVDGEGQLFYDDDIEKKVELDNTVYATSEQMKVLAKLDSLWNDIETISELYPDGAFRNKFMAGMKVMFNDIINSKPENGIKWKVEKLNELAKLNFGQNRKYGNTKSNY